MDMLQLQSSTPISGQVDTGDFNYFMFDVTCDDCTLLISLSTLGSGDPDLFINKGGDKLPSITHHDFSSTSFQSEVMYIDLSDPFFVENGITSMKDTYIIGVHGTRKSNYSLSISQEKYPVQVIDEKIGIQVVQDKYDNIYYLWYNFNNEKDFKINLNVKSGEADIYVNTLDDTDPSQNLVQRLPKSKREANWILENIKSTTDLSGQELLILNNERNYCNNCLYLIAVVTHDKETDYTISIDVLNADFANSKLMKLGESYSGKVKANQYQVLKFVVDDFSPITIIQQNPTGHIESYVSTSDNLANTFKTIKWSDDATIYETDQYFKTDHVFYIMVHAVEVDSEYTISVSQRQTVQPLKDGVPMKVKFANSNDTSKKMTLNL